MKSWTHITKIGVPLEIKALLNQMLVWKYFYFTQFSNF